MACAPSRRAVSVSCLPPTFTVWESSPSFHFFKLPTRQVQATEPVDKVGWIIRRILELGGYENVSDSVKADVFGFDITDVSGSIKLFSDVMKRLGIKLDGDELYEEFQRIYDESVNRDACKEKAEDRSCKKEQDSVHFI